jgi:hypothetical protein
MTEYWPDSRWNNGVSGAEVDAPASVLVVLGWDHQRAICGAESKVGHVSGVILGVVMPSADRA